MRAREASLHTPTLEFDVRTPFSLTLPPSPTRPLAHVHSTIPPSHIRSAQYIAFASTPPASVARYTSARPHLRTRDPTVGPNLFVGQVARCHAVELALEEALVIADGKKEGFGAVLELGWVVAKLSAPHNIGRYKAIGPCILADCSRRLGSDLHGALVRGSLELAAGWAGIRHGALSCWLGRRRCERARRWWCWSLRCVGTVRRWLSARHKQEELMANECVGRSA
ncbi:hypothetical protein L1887_47890 [Cichorium endivia]|nr:hypothetical protein L1887_47890 [Cichorium endivia]